MYTITLETESWNGAWTNNQVLEEYQTEEEQDAYETFASWVRAAKFDELQMPFAHKLKKNQKILVCLTEVFDDYCDGIDCYEVTYQDQQEVEMAKMLEEQESWRLQALENHIYKYDLNYHIRSYYVVINKTACYAGDKKIVLEVEYNGNKFYCLYDAMFYESYILDYENALEGNLQADIHANVVEMEEISEQLIKENMFNENEKFFISSEMKNSSSWMEELDEKVYIIG
jgi:hypothetical protein